MKIESALRELEWEVYYTPSRLISWTITGHYLIEVESGTGLCRMTYGQLESSLYDSLEAAKLAATQHFAARIKEAFKDEVWE